MVKIAVEFILTVAFLAGLMALALVKWRYESFKNIDLTAETQKTFHLKLVYFADESEMKYIPPDYVSVIHDIGSVTLGIIGLACTGYVVYFIMANSFTGFFEAVINFLSYRPYGAGYRSGLMAFFGLAIYCGLVFYGLFFVSGLIIGLLYKKYLVAPDLMSAFFGGRRKKKRQERPSREGGMDDKKTTIFIIAGIVIVLVLCFLAYFFPALSLMGWE